mgnify:CR=1 FL=1
MKKAYVKPSMESEMFVPHAYIAACGDTEYGNYLFECDAPGGRLYYYTTNWWGNEEAKYIGNYTPCNRKHEASRADEFPDGFIDYNRNGREDTGEAVVVWIERGAWGGIRNAHATTNLNRDSWETDKS